MTYRTSHAIIAAVTVALASAAGAHSDAPEGPIRERHQAMEKVGDAAKEMGERLKAGDAAGVAPLADEMAAQMAIFEGLFPEGSVHESSRAKPEIWDEWEEFVKLNQESIAAARALADAARAEDGLAQARRALFKTCKSCHKAYRVPKEDE